VLSDKAVPPQLGSDKAAVSISPVISCQSVWLFAVTDHTRAVQSINKCFEGGSAALRCPGPIGGLLAHSNKC
jgi:hypothetical protein